MDDRDPSPSVLQLDDVARRIIGALVEKQLATPQSYPLSVNALCSAANQTTNREPVTDFSEAEISRGLAELRDADLVIARYAKRSSTPRYAHLLDAYLEVGEAEIAVLCVLLLRGPQTLGELRQRTDRLHAFEDTAAVAATLDALARHPFGQLVIEMDRQPGQKENRWRHLLGGAVPDAASAVPLRGGDGRSVPAPDLEARVATLEAHVDELQQAMAQLRGPVDPPDRDLDVIRPSRCGQVCPSPSALR